MTPVEEVKSRLDIIDVISEYVQLKPAGANWRACCPFHEERTPSFMVSKSKQIWHCFGCGEGGDIISFVMKQEGLEFPDALRLLADKAGVRLRLENATERSERQSLAALLEAAVAFWSDVLWQQPTAKEARRYLQEQRHLQPETIRAWRLGYALDSWESLVAHLNTVGYKEEEMIKSGVAVRNMEMRGRGAYDRFRNRLIFPIANAQGQIVGVSGRTLSASQTEAKYVNTPETPLYRKGRILYGLDKAKTSIRQQNSAIIVEGNMDVIASHQAGVANVVATSGTALTAEQIVLLKRYTDNISFAFDADAAGESATMRGLVSALAAGCQVSLIRLPKRADGQRYKDPDDCIRDNPDIWRRAIAEAEPMLEYYFRRAVEERDLTKLEDKQNVTKLLLPLIARMTDAVAVSHYLRKLSNLVEVPERYLREALAHQLDSSAGSGSAQNIPTSSPSSVGARDSHSLQSERLLAALLAAPVHMAYVVSVITPEMLSSEYATLYKEIVVFYTEQVSSNLSSWPEGEFIKRFEGPSASVPIASQISVLAMLADKEFAGWAPVDVRREILATVSRLKKAYLKTVLQGLEKSIRTIEQSAVQDSERLAALSKEFQLVSAELVKLDNNKNAKP